MSRAARSTATALVAAVLATGAAAPALAATDSHHARNAVAADDDTRQAVKTFLARYAPELSADQTAKLVAAIDAAADPMLKRPDLQALIAKTRLAAEQWQKAQLSSADVNKVIAAFIEESAKTKPLDEQTRQAVQWLGAKSIVDMIHLNALSEFALAMLKPTR
ncbi:hypothetical protein AB0B50_13625 [Streptomyces sp. NPDC041068]|uniref:hypothetical protein n=1 Tax=Streptomyces sp. NPDC041068 TaxID=3155130 RepID=UPI0034010789